MKTPCLAFFVALLSLAVYCTAPVKSTFYLDGIAGNGTIYYQPDTYLLNNVVNPVSVSISYVTGDNTEAQICLSSIPVSGVNLDSNCPSGAYGTASNATFYTTNSLKLSTFNKQTNFIAQRLALADDEGDNFDNETTASSSLFVRPGYNAFTVVLPDMETLQEFVLTLTVSACDFGTVPINGDCTTVASASNFEQVVLSASQTAYLKYSVPTGVSEWNITVTGQNDGIEFFVQQGYLPVPEQWFVEPDIIYDDDDTVTYTLITPSYASAVDYYVAFVNTGDASVTANVTSTVNSCTSTTFGYECSHSTGTSDDPLTGYAVLSAELNSSYNGSTTSYDLSDSDNENNFAYFKLGSYPTDFSATSVYYIRVTVASNNDDGAPAFYAKLNAYPSGSSNTYNVSTENDASHQIIVPYTQADSLSSNVWWFSVKLPADFSIWSVANCADCDSDHGACYCDGVACSANDTTDPYLLPTTTTDSGGSCTCTDDDYDESYDCSTKNGSNLWILLIIIAAIVLLIIIIVAIALVIKYLKDRNRHKYLTVDGGDDD